MRRSTAAIAIIRRQHAGQTVWLAQWNDAWQGYHFVGGHKYRDESFRECVAREINEELGLAVDEFVVAENPLKQVSYIAQSRSAQEDTLYTMEVFEVQVVGERAELALRNNPNNRWLTEVEIRSRRCTDGKAVSETMELLLDELDRDPNGLP